MSDLVLNNYASDQQDTQNIVRISLIPIFGEKTLEKIDCLIVHKHIGYLSLFVTFAIIHKPDRSKYVLGNRYVILYILNRLCW